MDSLNRNINEPQIDILLAKYIIGEADVEEVSRVRQWISMSETNKKHVEQLRMIWDKSEALGYAGAVQPIPAWEHFLERITAEPAVSERPKLFWRRWLYAAAAVLIVAICSTIFLWHPNKQDSPVMLHYFSGHSMRTDTLPDGSVVILKPNSGLSFPSTFPANRRNVSLSGDASFSITHNLQKPFSIAVLDITVTVLGTRFDITSFPDRMEIAVQSGVVAISGRNQQQTLQANERLIVPAMDLPWIKRVDTVANTSLQSESKPNIPSHQVSIIKPIQEKPHHALMVGDKVPILPLDKWIKGGPLNVYDRSKVYLVDFWAVWCGPCIAGMETLSGLQKKYKNDGLEVMSVTSEDEWGNSYDKVKRFIDSNGKRFDYNFAWLPLSYRADHKYRSIIYNPWLELAYDSSSWALPQVFLIDRNGKFAFIGDGYNLEEDLIKRVLDNTYDTAQERKNYIEKLFLESEASAFLSLLDNKNIAAALDRGHGIVENPLVTAHTLMIVSDNIFNKYKDIQSKELNRLGFEAAKKGVRITGSHSPGHLAVLAKAYAVMNDPEQAVKIIKSAIDLAEGDYKAAVEKDLKEYEQMVKSKN